MKVICEEIKIEAFPRCSFYKYIITVGELCEIKYIPNLTHISVDWKYLRCCYKHNKYHFSAIFSERDLIKNEIVKLCIGNGEFFQWIDNCYNINNKIS